MPRSAVDMLRDLGISIVGGEGSRWTLRFPDGQVISRSLTDPVPRLGVREAGALLDRAGGPRPLAVADTSSPGLLRRAERGEIDLLLAEPLQIIVEGAVLRAPTAARPEVGRPSRRTRSWTRWAIQRLLVAADHALTQTEIAATLGTSQQNVSAQLRAVENVERVRSGGFRATSRAQLLQDWMSEYSGPGGVSFGWYSLDEVVPETLRAAEVAEDVGMRPLLSGDVAADEIAPWKLPGRGLLYVASPLDLEDDGFVPASVEEATLVTVVPRDPTLWAVAAWSQGHEPRLADPAIVYRDLLMDDAPDSPEAAAAFLESLLAGTS